MILILGFLFAFAVMPSALVAQCGGRGYVSAPSHYRPSFRAHGYVAVPRHVHYYARARHSASRHSGFRQHR
ncbi:MAG: hypothetical protein WAT39_21270 [Planctomycetota bacterium]